LFQTNDPEVVSLNSDLYSKKRRDQQEKIEQLEMSQICWDTDPLAEVCTDDSEPEANVDAKNQDMDPKAEPSRM
jgi:hypothetical protein